MIHEEQLNINIPGTPITTRTGFHLTAGVLTSNQPANRVWTVITDACRRLLVSLGSHRWSQSVNIRKNLYVIDKPGIAGVNVALTDCAGTPTD